MDRTSKKNSSGPLLLLLAVAFGILAFDQLTKGHIQYHFLPGESQTIIPGFLNLTYVTNTGIAFGLMRGEGSAWKQLILLTVTLLAIGFIFYFFKHLKSRGRGAVIALGMLLGGAIGNIVDRLRLGKVVDFLDFYIGRYHWPAFNVADAAITCGVLYLFFALYRRPG